jgi:hypothetical protein
LAVFSIASLRRASHSWTLPAWVLDKGEREGGDGGLKRRGKREGERGRGRERREERGGERKERGGGEEELNAVCAVCEMKYLFVLCTVETF